MAALEDFREKVKSESQRIWSQIQESSAYNQLKDRFENLSPNRQKALIGGAAGLVVLLLLSLPLTYLLSSADSIGTYEAQRDLIHDLFKIQQDSQSAMGLNPAPNSDSLRSRIDTQLQQAQLVPEQIVGTSLGDMPMSIPKERIDSALQVTLKKLNLNQIVDIGYQILSIHPAVKMFGLTMEANASDPRYFDVVYKIITLKVPVYVPPPPLEEENKAKKPSKGKSKSGGGDE